MNASKGDIFASSSGSMVLFDGTSCAGKTSICKLIESSVNVPYHYVALDDFITEIFEEQKRNPRPTHEFVATCNKHTELMYMHIDAMVTKGNNVLCDTTLTCLEDATSTHRWFSIINNINNFLILVYCPFDTVVRRLQQRNYNARIHNQPRNSRIASVVLRQFVAMFKAHSYRHGLVIDELSRHQIEKAFDLIRDDFSDGKNFQELRQEIMGKLGLFDHNKVFIAPRLFYNHVINTNLYPVEQCVKLVAEHLAFRTKSN
ncbi:MAG: AAA family ATPase [Candidatus Babeliales bacterium]